MADDIRDDRVSDKNELTTKDLAEAGEKRVRKFSQEPILTQAPASVDSRAEYQSDAARTGPGPAAAAARAKIDEELGPLFPPDEANNLRFRWDSVQVRFVDEPRQAVEDADMLIAATMKRLAEIFAEERGKLEHQWDRGGDVSTEDLRLGLRRYRSFFSRLLKV
jgi:hypothetical protein